MNIIIHEPVMIKEAIKALNIRKNFIYVDATFGLGGYSRKILETKGCNLIALDRDPDVKKFSTSFKKSYKNRFQFILGTFGSLKNILKDKKIENINGGIVADLGMSNLQIEDGKRGFSIKNFGPLDMRMSKTGVSAEHVVNFFKENELSDILWKYGEEYKSRKIAKRIVYERKKKKISTTHDLANLVKGVKSNKKPYRIHPATKTFQALRIFVNNELEELKNFISDSINLLTPGARLVLITFHSLEDRLVKSAFNKVCKKNQTTNRHLPSSDQKIEPKFERVGKSFYFPSSIEVAKNPKARSAKLRVIERVSL
ncbi:MAG: Ribosomal RNA small subunit methyltransferase H [Alphaproteobacteria bacterium MarineAlpha9_Bin4]|nr:hypothetical protein [Pelagibacterales bacterium]PPR27663.1 MAG: Ribosomal RNA small subunit methyltransferase H [Alphaproteobacteria bacterium MarineAlpha9_Bin4]